MPALSVLTLGKNETAESFLSRLAAFYGCERVPEFCLDFGIDFRSAITGREPALRQLAHLTGTDYATLDQNAIKSRNGSVTIGCEEIASQFARRNDAYGCPECLAEDIAANPALTPESAAYFRRDWAVGSILTCQRHRRPLVLIGARNPDRYNKYDTALMADGIAERLPKLLSDPNRREASRFEIYVSERLDGKRTGDHPLDALAITDVISLCRALGANAIRLMASASQPHKNDALYRSLSLAFDAIDGGQPTLREFFFDLITNHIRRIPHGPQILLGEAYNLILSTRKERFAPLAPIIANAIYDVLPYGIEDHPIAGVPVKFRRWYNPNQVYKIFGVSPRTAAAYGIAMGFAKVLIRPTDTRNGIVWLDATKSDETFGQPLDFGWKVSLKRLGLTKYGVAAVEAAGLLGPISSPGLIGKHGVPPVPRGATTEFIDHLAQRAVQVGEMPKGCKRLRMIACTVDGMKKVHAAILAGQVWVGQLPLDVQKPYHSFVVRNAEITNLLVSNSHMTISQFTQISELNPDSVYELMRTGELEFHTAVDEKSGCTIRVFAPDAAEAAREKYVNLMRLTGRSPRRAGALRLKLEAANVKPVSAIKGNAGVAYTFKRADVLPFL